MYVYNTPTLQGKSLNVHENFSSKHLAINLILRRFIAFTFFYDNHTYIYINTKIHQFKLAYHSAMKKKHFTQLYTLDKASGMILSFPLMWEIRMSYCCS